MRSLPAFYLIIFTIKFAPQSQQMLQMWVLPDFLWGIGILSAYPDIFVECLEAAAPYTFIRAAREPDLATAWQYCQLKFVRGCIGETCLDHLLAKLDAFKPETFQLDARVACM